MTKTVSLIGAGSRGRYTYSPYAKLHPDEMKVVAVAELREDVLEDYGREYGIPKEKQYHSAEKFFQEDKMSDFAFICTQDGQHKKHALMALHKGYDLLLEKPMAITLEDCLEITREANRLGRAVVVCHVLRYTPFYSKIKEVIDSGEIGQVVDLHQFENVGYWHYAHSYIRGNWRRESESSPMILAKCCHDLDILYWLAGKRCRAVSSFGSLKYFRAGNAPEGAGKRCTDGSCKIKDSCPFDAEKIYITSPITGIRVNQSWPVNVLTMDLTEEGITKALGNGPYGRCVFACDNDVVDHQIVNMDFEDGVTASLTMCGFSKEVNRELKVMCTGGELTADMVSGEIRVTSFGQKTRTITIKDEFDALNGHGGGDHMLLQELMHTDMDKLSEMSTNINDSLHSHLMAFAAELSRKQGGSPIELTHLEENGAKKIKMGNSRRTNSFAG